jgi:hypothetical protein
MDNKRKINSKCILRKINATNLGKEGKLKLTGYLFCYILSLAET